MAGVKGRLSSTPPSMRNVLWGSAQDVAPLSRVGAIRPTNGRSARSRSERYPSSAQTTVCTGTGEFEWLALTDRHVTPGAFNMAGDSSNTGADLAPARTVMATLAAFAGAGAVLTGKSGAPSWISTTLSGISIVCLGTALALSVREWQHARRRRDESLVGAGRAGRLLVITTAALVAATAGLIWYFNGSNHSADVRFDNIHGQGPYQVNGSCLNHTCVLYERRTPSIHSEKLARLREGQALTIACQADGEMLLIRGRPTSHIWDRLYSRNTGPYVSDYYTNTPGVNTYTKGIPRCSA
jgi:hypothetical protein